MTQYLYGAKVQGIQSFIFETNKLREIAGASELIESLSDKGFSGFFKDVGVEYQEDQLLRNAAGEILYLFPDRSSCEKVVRDFERYVATQMPGLTVSQAVVEIKDYPNLHAAANKVNRLLQVQRNRPSPPTELGLMISERARRTGRPGGITKDEGLMDRRQQCKREASGYDRLYKKLTGKKLKVKQFAFEMEHITNKFQRSWLAVVHADGNNLGKLIQKMLPEIEDEKLQAGYRAFSETLEAATQAAAQAAYRVLLDRLDPKERGQIEAGKTRLPIRPVVIGGDDLTVILRAEHAVAFTEAYLKAFEEETRTGFENFAGNYDVSEYFKDGLTACAGIAIVKPKYPFHYAAHLAEELCSWTKKIAKKIDSEHTPSSLHFHKVQASFVEDYKDIIEQELMTADGKHLTTGPYFTSLIPDGYTTTKKLLKYEQVLREKETPTGPLRDYLGELRVDPEAAAQKLERIRALNTMATDRLDVKSPFTEKEEDKGAPIRLYDALQLATL
ncbi:Cas10/Cmr2 second palm domain-containing protein [Neolewinella agarilytica]|uniref:Cas10/Cmr2 second palm domain-containing protein n=1 Tax=Neolewinella agarilytica TaxID=478744 RepID=A0A1H8Z7X4_9BACT|nr:hypothetical protein [Neolewinella agarilytica]SEP60486.1 hypothetical protein SAMN05444359_101212 [Neolewinella agarilytica]